MMKIFFAFLIAASLLIIPNRHLCAKSGCCELPAKGPQGSPGPMGPTGPQGPTGPIGPFGLGNSLSLTLTNTQAVVTQAAVLFDGIEQNQGGIDYDPATGVITLENVGFYVIKFGITTTVSDLQFGLRLNGMLPLVTGTVIDSAASDMVGIGLFFETTTPMSTLELLNNSGATAVIESTIASSNSAYLLIYQIK